MMSKVRKCDVCGEYEKAGATSTVTTVKVNNKTVKITIYATPENGSGHDYCNTCFALVLAALKAKL